MPARVSAFAASAGSSPTRPGGLDGAYRPGVCNIGPAEVARRRRVGHVGLIATIALLAVLVVVHAPPLVRLLVFLPAAGAASGYLQAALKFCAGFGSRGVFNFGELGPTEAVPDDDARARDRVMAGKIGLGAAAVGTVVAIVAVLLPV